MKMLKLTITAEWQPEFEAEYPTVEMVKDYAKSFWQSIVELINGMTAEDPTALTEEKIQAVLQLLKDAKAIAYFKMKTLGRIEEGKMSLDEMFAFNDVID